MQTKKNSDSLLVFPVINLCNTLRFFSGDDFQSLNNTWDWLMLKGSVFSLSMFANNNEIKIVMTSFQTFKVLDAANIGIDIQ